MPKEELEALPFSPPRRSARPSWHGRRGDSPRQPPLELAGRLRPQATLKKSRNRVSRTSGIIWMIGEGLLFNNATFIAENTMTASRPITLDMTTERASTPTEIKLRDKWYFSGLHSRSLRRTGIGPYANRYEHALLAYLSPNA